MSLAVVLALALVATKPTQGLQAAARPEPGEFFAIDGGVTPPLRDLAPSTRVGEGPAIVPGAAAWLSSGVSPVPQLLRDFAGLGAGDHGFVPADLPSDANGAVGATQYVQGVNKAFAVFDKTTGALVFGPASTDTLWTLMIQCLDGARRAPQISYDRAANRWIVMQTASVPATVPGTQPVVLFCLAVSRTADATGQYRTFAVGTQTGSATWVEGRLGVWPDAYYMTMDARPTVPPRGADACAVERAALLGTAFPGVACRTMSQGVNELLPSDLDGATPPPAGSPNFLVTLGPDSLFLWEFGPLVGSTAPLQAPWSIPASPYANACLNGGACITQPGTTQQLDSAGNRLMPRLAYRNFGDHDSLVVNHSIDAGGGVTGIRWYEIRSPGTAPTVFQQGTHAPTSDHRWMGSVAMDRQGNMALGHGVSSGSLFPSIRFAGRAVSDAPGTLGAEASLVEGAGSQVADSRWGAFSSLALDPADDCTFFYTAAYLKSTGTLNWSTRIGALRFPSCGASAFHTVVPCRLADTRTAPGPSGGPALAAGETRTLPIIGLCTIPTDASAVSVNLTAVQGTANGYLTLFAGDAPQAPLASTLNFSAGQTRGNNAIVALPLGGGGTVQVRNGSPGEVHLVLDASGYFK